MFCRKYPARKLWRRHSLNHFLATIAAVVSAVVLQSSALAQSYQRELDTPEKVTVSIKNRDGRVSVIASDDQQSKVNIAASSAGLAVDAGDVQAEAKGGSIVIVVKARREQDRIDVVVRIPSRSKVLVESEAGAVDVVGNIESATIKTNTGTIHADVPLDALKFDFLWVASRPRFLSDVELPKVKEKAGGTFRISGRLGEKKASKEELVALDFQTLRGVVLLNVDPSMVPSDLHERPLTEAARAIVRSGDSQLIEAIRKVSPTRV